MLLNQILADLIVVLHGSYVAFVIFGQLAVMYGVARKRSWARNFYFRWLHLLAIAVVVLQSWLNLTCPLTDLENYFRSRAGQAGYPGDFVGYWVHALLLYELSPTMFMVIYSVFGTVVLVTFVFAPPRGPRWRPKSSDVG